MAKTTDELFAEATEADYETSEPVVLAASDTEEEFQFRIDEHLRTIAIPEKGVVAGVEGDLNVNITRFTMVRYYHGRDLSKLSIRINYRNANGQVNYYNVSDAAVSGDSIVFSWEYAADVTQYKGNVQFVVYLFSATNAVLKQRFFTTLGTLEVLEGLEVDSSIPVSEQTDILLHLKKDLSAYAEEVKKSLPADYTAMTEQVSSLKEDLEKLNEGGLNLKDEVITQNINNWLDRHPESTTTVQDGAIGERKINVAFLQWIKKDYVTPEMFGAVGDGVTDDTGAVLRAISTGFPIRGLEGAKYVVKSGLEFENDCNIKDIYLIAGAAMTSVIRYKKRHTIIDNVQIDCNNLANYGILGSDAVPDDTLFFAQVSNSFAINAVIDGFNTGEIRTFFEKCIAKFCKRAGFYVGASDTKHDCLVPVDCRYGVYIARGNTNINRYHPWSWDTKQIGLYIEADKIVNIQYYFNDTNDIGIAFEGGVKLTIHTIANLNNTNAPSAVDVNSRMLVKVGENNKYTSVFINNLIGSFEEHDDYFLYPDIDIGNMRVDNISLTNVNSRFDKKMFRMSYIPKVLYPSFLCKLSISSDALNIDKVTIKELTANLRGYTANFEISFDSAKLTIDTMTDILQIYYTGTETSVVKFYLNNICASFTAASFHIIRKENAEGYLKGCAIRLNNDFEIHGILVLNFKIEIQLY